MTYACRCGEHKRIIGYDLPKGSNERPRQWFVYRRNESRSVFNGYRSTWSDYSHVYCRVCNCHWKTKAEYVGKLPDCEYWPKEVAPRAERIEP